MFSNGISVWNVKEKVIKIYTYDYQQSVLWSQQDCYAHELMKLELPAQDLKKVKPVNTLSWS